jgi:hypothetical protein
MQPEIHATEPAVPASDLLPPQRRKGIPRVTAILGIGLLAAATFLAGIEAQKQWGGSSSSNTRAGAFAARFANAGGAAGAAGTGTGTGTGTNGAAGAGAPGAGGFAGRGGGFTTGTVKLVKGTTLYITTTNGNTVRVSVPAATAITKTVTTKLTALKPGDNVTAIGTAGSDGVIKAARVTVGTVGFGGFGGGGFGRRAGANGGTQGANGGATPAG